MIRDNGKLEIAFYRSRYGNWVDGLINQFSTPRLGFSHNELVFPDGWSISSTMRDPSTDRFGGPVIDFRTGKQKKNGVRWKLIDFADEKWAFHQISCTLEQVQQMQWYADTTLQSGYDFWGLFRFVPWYYLPLLPFRVLSKPSPTDYWCTEHGVDVAQSQQLLNRFTAWMMSPNLLAAELGVR